MLQGKERKKKNHHGDRNVGIENGEREDLGVGCRGSRAVILDRLVARPLGPVGDRVGLVDSREVAALVELRDLSVAHVAGIIGASAGDPARGVISVGSLVILRKIVLS